MSFLREIYPICSYRAVTYLIWIRYFNYRARAAQGRRAWRDNASACLEYEEDSGAPKHGDILPI